MMHLIGVLLCFGAVVAFAILVGANLVVVGRRYAPRWFDTDGAL